MSNQGYEIVEPDLLANWLSSSRNREFAVAFLFWLVARLRSDYESIYPEIEIDVIKVEYSGAYPAIGIRHPHADKLNLTRELTDSVTGILNTATALEFASYVFASKHKWSELTAKLQD